MNTAKPCQGAFATSDRHFNARDHFGKKPEKPYPAFPLFAHANGWWAKKIRGRLHYFGPWVNAGPDHGADAALQKYLAEKDDLHAGRTPRPARVVKDVANLFLNAKREAVEAGELALRTWKDYRAIMDMLVEGLGKNKPVSALDPQDFTALKNQLAQRNGPARMCTVIQVIRCAFKHAYESVLLDRPMRFGPVFKRTSKKTLRIHRAKQGANLFTAEEIRRLLGAAGVHVRAMILLGINPGGGAPPARRQRQNPILDSQRRTARLQPGQRGAGSVALSDSARRPRRLLAPPRRRPGRRRSGPGAPALTITRTEPGVANAPPRTAKSTIDRVKCALGVAGTRNFRGSGRAFDCRGCSRDNCVCVCSPTAPQSQENVPMRLHDYLPTAEAARLLGEPLGRVSEYLSRYGDRNVYPMVAGRRFVPRDKLDQLQAELAKRRRYRRHETMVK